MQKYINQNTDNRYNFMNFFDDIIDNKYSKLVDQLCLILRNSNISTWLSTQYPYLISKKNRTNINSFFFFRFHNHEFLDEIIRAFLQPYFKDILGKNYNKESATKLYHDVTANHGFIYLVPFEDRCEFYKLQL
jgi:hypothetical protein